MADPVVGGYPPEQEAPGAQALRGLAAGGFNQDEVVQYKQKNSSLMLNNGFTQKEVDQYWGDDHPAPPVSATNYANAQMAAVPPDQKPAAATDWWEALNAGLQDTGEGRTLRGLLGINHGEPSTVMPEHVGLGMTIANAIGSGISSLPSWITGATVATPVGAAAGAAVPGAGETGASEVVGGLAAAGAGGNVASQSFRQVVMDYQQGRIHTFNDMWASITKALYDAKDAALVGAAMGPLAHYTGGMTTKIVDELGINPMAGKIASKAGSIVGGVTAATVTGAALQGRLPTLQDFQVGAATMVGFEAFTHVGGRLTPSASASRVMSNLSRIWVEHGIDPKTATALAQKNPVLRQEILGQDPQGNPVTPNLKEVAPAEPPSTPAPTPMKPTDLMVARKLPDGTVVRGTKGQLHMDLLSEDELNGPGIDDTQMGFHAGPGTPFMSRAEAAAASGQRGRAEAVRNTEEVAPAFGRKAISPGEAPNLKSPTNPKELQASMGTHTINSVADLMPIIRIDEGSRDDAISLPQGKGGGGAIGRYQITPGTARQYGFDPTRLTDPDYNTKAAQTILTDLWHRYKGNVDDIALAYHSGQGTANRWIAAGRPLDAKVMGEYGMKYVLHTRSQIGHPGFVDPAQFSNPENGGATGANSTIDAHGNELPTDQLTLDQVRGRVHSMIATPEDKNSLWNEVRNYDLDNVYSHWVSELGPAVSFDRLAKAEEVHNGIGSNGGPAMAEDNSKIWQMNLEDSLRQTYASRTRADYFLKRGTLSPAGVDAQGRPEIVHTSDDSIMSAYRLAKENGGNEAGFEAYLLAARTAELEGRGIKTRISGDDAAVILKADSEKYRDAAAMWTRTQDATLDYARESGRFSAKQVEDMKRANMHYVTYAPILDKGWVPPSVGGNKFKPGKGPQKIEGGTYKIQDLVSAAADNMQRMISDGDRNRAVGNLVQTIEKFPNLKTQFGITELTDPAIRELKGGDQYSAVMRDQGITEEQWNQVKDIAPARSIDWTSKANQTKFPYYEDGRLRVFDVKDPELASLFRGGAGELQPNGLLKVAEGLARLQRSGITLDPSYGARMVLRHEITGTIFDKNGGWFPYQDLARGFFHVMNRSDLYDKVWANGGLGAAMADMDRDYLRRDLDKIMNETGMKTKMWNTFTQPMHWAEAIGERMSAMAHVGYVARNQDKFGLLKGATMARTAKIDFAEKTSLPMANTIAKTIPFQRARVLGWKQQYEAFRDQPYQTFAKLILFTAIPAALFNVWNRRQDKDIADPREQYGQLDRFTRDTQFVTPQIDGVRMKQLAPPGIATMVNMLTNRLMDHLYEHSPDDYKHMSEVLEKEFSPGDLPTLATPFLEATTNTNWFSGKSLIPASMEHASGSMQYTPNTTPAAIALGRIIGNSPLDIPLNAAGSVHTSSPIMLEQLVRDWGGSLGMAALSALNYPLTGHLRADQQSASVLDNPFVQSFFISHPQTSPDEINRFYDAYNHIQELHQDRLLAATRLLETGDRSEWNQYRTNPAAYLNLARAMKAMKIEQEIIIGINHNDKMTVDEKRQHIATAASALIMTARQGLKMMQMIDKGQ